MTPLESPIPVSPHPGPERFVRLWGRAERAVASVVRRRAPDVDPEEREDLVQDVRVRAWRGFGRYDPAVPFERWTCGIAHKACADRYRERASRVAVVPNAEGGESLDQAADPGPSPFEVAARNDLSPILAAALDELAPRHRRALRMVAAGADLAEVAEVLGCTPARASQIVNAARRKVAAALTAHARA